MPKDGAQAGRYTIRQNYRGKKGWSVVGNTGVVHGTHATRDAAINQQSAIYASQANSKKSASEEEKAVITNETTPNKYPQPVKAKKKKRFTDYEMTNKSEHMNPEDLFNLLVPQEKAFYSSLIRIAEEYGPFDKASSGVWVGYELPSENEVANIGVKCGNCAFHYDKAEGTLGCKLLSFEIQENSKCRLAAIPDGLVNTEMDDNMNDSMDDNMNDNMDRDHDMDDMGKAIESIDLIKETIAAWGTEIVVDNSPVLESDSSEKIEVPEDLSSIFSNMPAHAKRVNTTGNAPISLNLFRNEEHGRRNL